MHKFTFTALLISMLAWPVSFAPAEPDIDLAMDANITLDMEIIDAGREMLPAGGVDQEWIDSWTADANGWVWYTPQKYDFTWDDTISCNIFYVTGEYWNLVLTNAFYHCGETDWRNYVYTWVHDFGTIPPIPPGYGWIVHVTHVLPEIIAEVDWASRLAQTGNTLYGGTPLSGRPDCFTIEPDSVSCARR